MSFRFTESAFCFTAMAGEDVETVSPLSLTNAQKLSLSPSTPVGTRVAVSDGFVVSGSNPARGFYRDDGTTENGKKVFSVTPSDDVGSGPSKFHYDGVRWRQYIAIVDDSTNAADGDEIQPWDADWSATDYGPITLTHPAIQQLAAPGGGALLVSGGSQDGVYRKAATLNDGKPFYPFGSGQATDGPGITWWTNANVEVGTGPTSPAWVLSTDGPTALYYSLSDTPTPLTATNWKNASDDSPASITIALTDPQGGVAVLGETQDGVYPLVGDGSLVNGRSTFFILGSDPFDVSWSGARWEVRNDESPVYYSLSDVATPDLATNWKNAADDTPASITVTSVSVGEIYAGLFVTNDGVTNGSSYVSQPFHGRQYYMGLNGGGSNNMHWDTDFNVWTDDVGVWTTDNVAFPWQGTDSHTGHDGATFIRNDVANEANWR